MLCLPEKMDSIAGDPSKGRVRYILFLLWKSRLSDSLMKIQSVSSDPLITVRLGVADSYSESDPLSESDSSFLKLA